MLYLAEVQKKASGFLGSSAKAELKLLALQRNDQSWSAVPGEELVVAPEEANNLGNGAIVLVELGNNKQVQRIEQSRQLVNILQNFSKQQEKVKTQEEEIEQWKQSLTYQSQELNRREMEMEAERDQLEELKKEVERLPEQRQEIDHARDEVNRLREESDRKSQELEGAWQQLRNEMQRLEQQQTQLQQSSSLNQEQSGQLQELINQLLGAIAPGDLVREELNIVFEILNAQQGIMDRHWHEWEPKHAQAEQMQKEVDEQAQVIPQRWQEWYQTQASLEQARLELKVQQNTFHLMEARAQKLREEIETQKSLQVAVSQLANATTIHSNNGNHGDVEAFEKMPLDQLQGKVQELEREWENMFNFVHAQEEELAELKNEPESYEMLNRTLEGQRRSLREKEEILNQYQCVLWKRQGRNFGGNQSVSIDISPVLGEIEKQFQHQTEELQNLENQIQQLKPSLEEEQRKIEQQTTEQEAKRNELKELEQNWHNQKVAVGEIWSKLNLYQDLLQPAQDRVNEIRQKLEAMSGVVQQVQESGGTQHQAIAQIQTIISSLTKAG